MDRSRLLDPLGKFLDALKDPDKKVVTPPIPQDQFFYYSLIPVTFAVIFLAFLKRRRWKRLDILNGRPGVPWPINFLEERNNRLLYVAAFGLISWTAWDALTGDIPFWSKDQMHDGDLHDNLFVKNLARLSACLMSALICYPIFGAIASDHILGYAFGTLYVWAYSIVYMISNYPTDSDGVEFAIDMIQLVPACVCMVYLCIQLPFRCWKRGWKHWAVTNKHQSEHSMWSEDVKASSAYQYVQTLMAANRPEGIAVRKRTLMLSASKLYRNISGFRYSLSILVGVLVSIQFVFVGTLDMMKVYKNLIEDLRYPLEEPSINRSQLASGIRSLENAILNNTQLTTTQMLLIHSLVSLYSNEAFKVDMDDVKSGLHKVKEDVSKFRTECLVWLNAFEASCYVSVTLAFIVTAIAVLLTLRNYRRHLLLLYRGQRLPIVPSAERDGRRPTDIVTNGAKYVGFQFGYAIWGFVYQAVLLLIICFSLSALYLFSFRYHKAYQVWMWIRDFLGPITTYVLGLLIVQRILVHFCFLQRDERKKPVLAFNNRRLLWNFQYFMVFANSTIGLVSCLVRIIKAVLFGAWILPRLDVSMLNRHFERFDNGYAAYAGLLAIESCHTNPVLVSFTKLLWLSQIARQSPHSSEDDNTDFDDRKELPTRRKCSRSRTIRNRWHLYVTLHHNPGLRLLRKEAIRIDRLMHAEEVILDDALIEAPRLRFLLRRLSDRKELI